jgi:hypothetical protein
MLCVTCEQPVDGQPYRLIGVERGTWKSLYAHRGACEDEARRLHSVIAPVPVALEGALVPEALAEAEELTMEAPEPFHETDAPWFGMERRR